MSTVQGDESLTLEAMDDELNDLQAKAEAGDTVAQVELGRREEAGRGKDRSSILGAIWFAKASDAGDPDGAFELAGLYEEGKGVPQSYREANLHYQRAAAGYTDRAIEGNLEAMSVLGMMHYVRMHPSAEDEEAYHWLSKAAHAGDAWSQYWLGEMYSEGRCAGICPEEQEQNRQYL